VGAGQQGSGVRLTTLLTVGRPGRGTGMAGNGGTSATVCKHAGQQARSPCLVQTQHQRARHSLLWSRVYSTCSFLYHSSGLRCVR
jgi:hypothetical protein